MPTFELTCQKVSQWEKQFECARVKSQTLFYENSIMLNYGV